ncbi:MAG TPA: hypothetical protein VK050_00050 [Flavobacteriaceae bacterium]|nr:hypothetical protein [Flavobacteriaceae bacterium]
MARNPTFPSLYDNALQLSITSLKNDNFIQSNIHRKGVSNWTIKGKHIASINIEVKTADAYGYIILDYSFNDKPISYKVGLTTIKSNLGNGLIWYFVCPKTNKRCRILYQIKGMFLHREAFPNAMYYTQTRCKLMRHLETKFGDMVGIHRLYDKIHQKHFKKYYNGKPTKRYKKLMERINKAQSIPYDVYFREFNKYIPSGVKSKM